MSSPNLTPDEIMQKVSTGKPFVLLLLITGAPPPEDQEEANHLQMEHLSYLFRLEAEGKSLVFGPTVNDERLRGIIVFNTASKDDVRQWMADDPWIKGGYLTYELYDWFSIPRQGIR